MFFPALTQPQQMFAAWTKMATDNLAKLEALEASLKETENRQYAQAQEAIDETAKLMKASITYWQELHQSWRKQTIEATKQAASMGTTL
ncbi:MAG: hypothetical protein KC731_14085 [Myxococcales bacterium]|nr:hypothetical protein [Myxococcales bacterium]